jgi:hypothetical protein
MDVHRIFYVSICSGSFVEQNIRIGYNVKKKACKLSVYWGSPKKEVTSGDKHTGGESRKHHAVRNLKLKLGMFFSFLVFSD